MRCHITYIVVAAALAAGCAQQPPPTTRPSIATTQPSYWLAQPPAATITGSSFARLWDACGDAARDRGFQIDREDYRGGLLTTVPLVSEQWFEVWRDDVLTADDLAESSLATYRRTLRFQFAKLPDGSFRVTPAVVIERYVQAERPITAAVYLRYAFRTTRGQQRVGSAESDRGIYLPQRYWYATGRDIVLERDIARAVKKRIRK